MSQIEPFLDTPIKRRKKRSRLRRGLMQSYLLFVSVVVSFTLDILLFTVFKVPFADNRFFLFASMVLLVVGVFRLAFALIFESDLTGPQEDQNKLEAAPNAEPKLIDGRSSVPIRDLFHPTGATTNDLKPLVDTVTDPTTQHLQREDE